MLRYVAARGLSILLDNLQLNIAICIVFVMYLGYSRQNGTHVIFIILIRGVGQDEVKKPKQPPTKNYDILNLDVFLLFVIIGQL